MHKWENEIEKESAKKLVNYLVGPMESYVCGRSFLVRALGSFKRNIVLCKFCILNVELIYI